MPRNEVEGVGGALVSIVLAFADQLRAFGVDLPTSGLLDAVVALTHVDLGSRQETRVALATTLVKRSEDLPAFDAAFERWFAPGPSLGLAAHSTDAARPPNAGVGASTLDRPPAAESVADEAAEAAAIRDGLARALATGDIAALGPLAARAVRRWAGLDTVSSGDRYHLHRLLRGLDLSAIGQEALRRERDEHCDGVRRSPLEERLARADIEALLDRFRRLLADELLARRAGDSRRRSRSLHDLDPPAAGRLDEVDFLRASTQELRQMCAAIRPLARKLAAKVAQQPRHSRSGRLDMRRTLRASLESGGVPLYPAFRQRRRTRPELCLLCDVSGSVAEFSRFTLAFVYALHEELSGLRTFVFVDDVDEITDVLDRRLHDVDPFALLVRASAAGAHRRSDYGRVLRRFLDEHGPQLSTRATLIITGDARSHHRDPAADALRALRHRSRRVWFLNPEPRRRWDQGDSVASLYGAACDRMAEVRNLAQLADCVTELL